MSETTAGFVLFAYVVGLVVGFFAAGLAHDGKGN
jgi:hypothetical protein